MTEPDHGTPCPTCSAGYLEELTEEAGDSTAAEAVYVQVCRICGTLELGPRLVVPTMAQRPARSSTTWQRSNVARDLHQAAEATGRDDFRRRAGAIYLEVAEALLETSFDPHPSTR